MTAPSTIRLVPVDHGKGFSIDRRLFEQAGIDPEGPVDVRVEGSQLVMSSPRREGARRRQIDAIVEEMDEKYGDMMQRLANERHET